MTSKLEYALLRILGIALSRMPGTLETPLFRLLWPFFQLRKSQELVRVAKHVERATLRTTPRVDQIYHSLFSNGLDSLRYLHRHSRMESRVHVVNRHLLQNLLNAHQPVVVVSIHTGAFEMLHRSLTHFGQPVHLLTSEHYRPALSRFLERVRHTENLRIHAPSQAPRMLHELIRGKGILALMVDQSRTGKGNQVDFLGHSSSLWMRLPQEALRAGASVVTFRALRKGNQHILKFETVYGPQTSPEELLEQTRAEFERWIIENPEQWTWNYPGLWRLP